MNYDSTTNPYAFNMETASTTYVTSGPTLTIKTLHPYEKVTNTCVTLEFNKGHRVEFFLAEEVKIELGATYKIRTTDGLVWKEAGKAVELRTLPQYFGERVIAEAKLIAAAPIPDDGIDDVWVNMKKLCVTVKWKDKTTTTVQCQEEDFDQEKAIALCYMKKKLGNRGSFNETLKKYGISVQKVTWSGEVLAQYDTIMHAAKAEELTFKQIFNACEYGNEVNGAYWVYG